MSMQSFADLGVSETVARALERRKIDVPFPVQEAVMPRVLEGRDVLVRSPTGSGKTLAFGIPLVDIIQADDPRCAALVLVPTRELASQIVEALREIAAARALSIAAVYGGVGLERQAKLARRAHIIVATPGRLEDLIARRAVRLDRVRVLVLDEADRMLDMGFRPPVERIVRQTPSDRQTLFLSATLDGETGRLAAEYTREPHRYEQEAPKQDRIKVEHRFVAVAHEDKLSSLVDALRAERDSRTLVFVRTKRGADRLVKRLKARGVEAAAMHGDKSQSQREKALRRFDSGQVAALVATDVAARGIDVDGITHVINFDAPGGPRHLRAPRGSHRPGRAHRDRHHVRDARPGPRREPHRPRSAPARAVRGERAERRRRAWPLRPAPQAALRTAAGGRVAARASAARH